MQVINSRWKLKTCDTKDYVWIKSTEQLFVHDGHDWIEKRYFTGPEIKRFLGINENRLFDYMSKLNLRTSTEFRKRIRLRPEEMIKIWNLKNNV